MLSRVKKKTTKKTWNYSTYFQILKYSTISLKCHLSDIQDTLSLSLMHSNLIKFSNRSLLLIKVITQRKTILRVLIAYKIVTKSKQKPLFNEIPVPSYIGSDLWPLQRNWWIYKIRFDWITNVPNTLINQS